MRIVEKIRDWLHMKTLRNLSSKEKAILRAYLEQDSKTMQLDEQDPTVRGLVRKGIIYKANQ